MLPQPPKIAPPPEWWDELDRARHIVLVTQGTLSNADFGQLLEPAPAAWLGMMTFSWWRQQVDGPSKASEK